MTTRSAFRVGTVRAHAKLAPNESIVDVPKTTYPSAVCNNGDDPIYYFRQNTASTVWLFYLEGGEECNDLNSCTIRANGKQAVLTQGASSNWTPYRLESDGVTRATQGILSTDPNINPVFYNANIVDVHYCSSDYWSGGKYVTATFDRNNSDMTWSFEGRAVAIAAMIDLRTRTATTKFGRATNILFAGSSAGGIGITVTLNDLLPYAPAKASKLLAVDAGFSLHVLGFDPVNGVAPNYTSNSSPGDSIITTGISYWVGHGDSACSSAPVSNSALACYTSQTVFGGNYIPLAAFIGESQLDSAQLRDNGWMTQGGSPDAAHMGYAHYFSCAMKASLMTLPAADSVYAPGSYMHELFVLDSVFPTTVTFPPLPPPFTGTSLSPSTALATWYGNALSGEFKIFGDPQLGPCYTNRP